MRKLYELGISPAPWKVIPYGESTDSKTPTNGDIEFANGEAMYLRDVSIILPMIADARLIAAAPELYKWLAFAVEYYKCETRSCDKCPNGKCWIVDATAALAKAAGEEVRDGK